MGRHQRSRSASGGSSATRSDIGDLDFAAANLDCPFGRVDALGPVELRETAYEIFFMSCRSSGVPTPARGGAADGEVSSPVAGAGPKGGGAGSVMGSRIKKALGLRARRLSSGTQPMMGRTLSQTSGPASPGRARRPMTSAEIMRQQMRVTEQSDARLRRTLMRAVVGQVGRRAETIILPLELLRQLKQAEFSDAEEYHQWQFRQIKLLEAGLILHPSLPLDRLHSAVLRFREVMRATEIRAIDTGKNSDAMRNLTNAVHALAWRPSSSSGATADACHWADGYPLNVLLYVSLLQTVFDLREPTVVLDEVDELLELIKKTWPTLGVNRVLHNVCFAWALFQQYVVTGQIEPDLAAAALAVLADVAADAKQGGRDPVYAKVLVSALGGMQEWSEKRLLDYHGSHEKGFSGSSVTEVMEVLLSLALAVGKIVADWEGAGEGNFAGDRILENGLDEVDSVIVDRDHDPGVVLMQLARDTEQLAIFERRNFSPVLRRWHPAPVAVAAVTLHGCYGVVLRQYLAKDAADCDDGRAKAVVGDMEPYEVETVVMGLLKTWMDDKLMLGRDCILRAKDTESWIPKSKEEPFAGSAMELTKLARATVDEFAEIPASAKDEVVHDLVDGLESIFQDYISFVASCGSKQSYLPPLPPLTRCNQNSGFFRLWKRAVLPTCQAPDGGGVVGGGGSHHIPRPSISRGTQRLYVRLNTLHYVLTHLHALDKSLSSSSSSSSCRFDRFARADHAAVGEDFRSLKRAFCTCGEGLVPEEVVEREAETAEAVIDLMARSTEHLIDAFGMATCASIIGPTSGGDDDDDGDKTRPCRPPRGSGTPRTPTPYSASCATATTRSLTSS
ncbi:hypothetical protein PR202_ga00482 [Eleusine coracana subsp. coracana]|uniref:MHD1 domain-containing protein n=1 Tax=Eleusine coracana subsp. coracana TaxID=191504 RepID=A0AAV5BDG5_ELECO|nr:hypothetical protein PR202_ga00482 [Eleusine coracana subsp. coracana]